MAAYDYDEEQIGNLFIVKKDGSVGSAFPVFDGEIMIGRYVCGSVHTQSSTTREHPTRYVQEPRLRNSHPQARSFQGTCIVERAKQPGTRIVDAACHL